MTEASATTSDDIDLTTEIVCAYVRQNSVPMAELPSLIRTVYQSVTGLGSETSTAPAAEPLKPAVPIKKSITDEFIISLEDGRKLKSLKRYLTKLGMTPADYRAKWGLPADYPMVAPSYAAQRSALAKTLGLGRKPKAETTAAPAPEPKPQSVAAVATPKRKRQAA